jgi:hypothetical protein
MGRANLERLDGALALADGKLANGRTWQSLDRRRVDASGTVERGRSRMFAKASRNGRFLRIALKNSQIEQLRKSRSGAHSVVSADGRHGKPSGRVTGGKASQPAEPLTNFPSRLPAVF